MSTPQAEAVAKIALEIPEHPSALDILHCLNKAYRQGFDAGWELATTSHLQMQEVLSKLLP